MPPILGEIGDARDEAPAVPMELKWVTGDDERASSSGLAGKLGWDQAEDTIATAHPRSRRISAIRRSSARRANEHHVLEACRLSFGYDKTTRASCRQPAAQWARSTNLLFVAVVGRVVRVISQFLHVRSYPVHGGEPPVVLRGMRRLLVSSG